MAKRKQIAVENVNCPGKLVNVDAEKYAEMKRALLSVLPKSQPGLNQAEMFAAVKPFLPQELWPNGEKSGWWVKTVQLDLEAKGLVVRTKTKPLTWHLT
jgi:hypothetical protein